MKPEIEATFININKDSLRAKLKSLGGKLLQKETLMRRTVFDIDKDSFVRVRDEGNRITMSYKHCDDNSLTGMKEICLTVNDYDEAINFNKACGLKIKAEQETYREEWLIGNVEIDIDTWPWIPSFVEIEGPSEEAVINVAKQLGFDMKDARYGSVVRVFEAYYDVTDADINTLPEIKFTEVPAWLEAKRLQKSGTTA